MRRTFFLVAVLCCSNWGATIDADTLHLTDGKKVEGKILEEGRYSVKIEVKGLPMTYYFNEIQDITRDQPPDMAPEEADDAQVPEETRQLILRLFDVNGVREGIAQRLEETISKNPPEDQEFLRQRLFANEIVDRLVPVYAKYYTVEEINQMLEFYSSQVGQKQIELLPVIMEETVQVSLQYFQDKLPPANTP